MRLSYQVNFEVVVDESDLNGLSPKDFIEEALDGDTSLIELSTVKKVKFLKIVKGLEKDLAEDEDDDGLTELDEDELEFED